MDNRDSDFILDLRFFNSLLGPAEPPAVITMDGVIITIGETSQRKPPSVWRLFRLSQSALAARGPYAKAAKVSLDGLCPLRFVGGFAASSGARTRCLFLFGRTTSIRRRVRFQCVGPTIPDSLYV